mgnify:CR=1 FL=1
MTYIPKKLVNTGLYATGDNFLDASTGKAYRGPYHSNFDGISKDDLKFVHHIHHKLASLITDHLSHDLNVKIELHTVTATQLLYSDFIDSLNDNVFQANINFSEQGAVVLQVILSNTIVVYHIPGLCQGIKPSFEWVFVFLAVFNINGTYGTDSRSF